MSSRHRHRGPCGHRAFASLAALVLTALLLPAPASAAPRTTADASPLRITITALGPTSLAPTDTLMISARVVNASDTTVTGVGARLRVGSAPIGSRGELTAFATSTGDQEVGAVATASLVDVAPALAPGATAEVQIEVPADQLGLVGGFGVHPLTLELRTDAPDGIRRTAATARTFVVTAGTGSSPTVRVAWVWPLVGTPARDVDGVLPASAAASLSAALRPDGRLGSLLGAGAGAPVSWLVDGALLEDVRSLATGNGLPAEVQPDPAAASWLQRLTTERARRDSDVRALPYADPDLVAVRRAGLAADLVTARAGGASTVSALLDGTVEAGPSWPGSGLTDRPTLAMVQGQHAGPVLLASGGLTPQTALLGTPDAVTPLTDFPDLQAVATDSPLSALLVAGPAHLGGLVLARQRLLAETAMVAAERPADPRSLVGAPPRRWAPTPSWAQAVAGLSAPWLQPTTLTELLAHPGDAPARTIGPYPGAVRRAEVTSAQLAMVSTDRIRLDGFAPVVADPASFLARYEPGLLSAQSTAWRSTGQPAGRTYTTALTKAVTAAVTSVRLLPRGQVTLSSRSGIIPLAVQNALDQDVRVRVRVTATPSVRLRSSPTEVIVVPAGRTASVDVPAEATTDGTFPVVATLLTESGHELGRPVAFPVRATGYGQVARIVVGGALILLAVAVVVRVARRIRGARSADGGTLDP